MLFTLLTLLIICIALLIKFRARLAFATGRLSRVSNPIASDGRFIELSFGKVHYLYRASTKASSTVNIFVHGFSIPMQIWQHAFQAMADDGQACLTFDLYGRGWSDAPDVPMNVDLFVSQLAELLYALDLPYDRYNLLGVSMGGMIVQRFTELYPKRVSALVLCCAAGLNTVSPPPLLMFIMSIPILGPLLFKFVMTRPNSPSVRAQWAFPDRDTFQEYQQTFLRACVEHRGYLRSLFSTVRLFDFQSAMKSATAINKLNLPVLVLWGDKDALIPVENAYRYHQLYTQSTLSIVPGANHSLLIEHPNETTEAIKTLLNTLPTSHKDKL
jgi:pimeloyl-ACP methyl ester carboxylesterase